MSGDVSSTARMAGGVLLAPIAASGLLVLPVYVGGLIDHLGISPQDALFIVSLDMWGMAAALLPAYVLMRRISWRLLGMAMLLAMVVCFAVPALVYADAGEEGVTAIGVWRLLGGVCSGTLMALVLSTLGKLQRADRAFSLWVLTQILFKVAAIYGLAIVLKQAGMQGFFLSLAALACLGLPLAWTLPDESWAEQPRGRAEWSGKAIMSLTGLVAFYIALSALWANFESIGKTQGFAVLDIAAVLSLTSLAGLAGATLSTLLAGRIAHLHALAGGIALIATAGYGLSRFESLTAYTVVGTAFAFAWFFTVPLLLATVNRNDHSGRLMVFANAAIAFGVAAGPSLSGVIVTQGSYRLLSTLGAAAFLLVFLLVFPSARED
jgi:predicted MFS family arabinose efflux permease